MAETAHFEGAAAVNRNSGNGKEMFLLLSHSEENKSAVEFGQAHAFQVFADGFPWMARSQFHPTDGSLRVRRVRGRRSSRWAL